MAQTRLDPQSLLPGCEEFAEFSSKLSEDMVCLYHYRRSNGELFTCAHYSPEDCRRLRKAKRQIDEPEEFLDLAMLLAEPLKA